MDLRSRGATWLIVGWALFLCTESAMSAATSKDPIDLPPPQRTGTVSVEAALAARHSVREFAPAALSLAQLGQLLWAAQGITHGPGLRTAPSAGALYPLEVYVACARVRGLEPGVYRYQSSGHRLQPVTQGDPGAQLSQAAYGQEAVREAPAVLVFAAVLDRTQRKYGARAQRYVDLEIGHAAENVALQAAALGLATVPVGAFDDAAAARAAAVQSGAEVRYLMPVGLAEPR